jgi:hypothetical protein
MRPVALRALYEHVSSVPGHLSPARRTGQGGIFAAFFRKVFSNETPGPADFAVLQDKGATDDQIFEATITASVSAGLYRIEAVNRLLGLMGRK